MNNPTIHVALASDNNYFEGLLTTVWTLARNCSRPKQLTLNILDGGITEENWSFLKNSISKFGSALNRVPIDQTATLGKFKSYHSSKMTYARLLLPDLLPGEVHQIIYSDVDILWLVDVAELWDSLDPSAVIHSVPNIAKPSQHEIDWFRNNGFPYRDGQRFCAGMIVLNLDIFRREKLHIQMLNTLTAHQGYVPNNDETILNAYMFGRPDRKSLPHRWQHSSSPPIPAYESVGFVLHFAADTPWKSIHSVHHMLTHQILLWHQYHAVIRKITTWESLRQSNNTADIIFCRALYIAAIYLFPFRTLLRTLLILKGNRNGINCLNNFMRRPNLANFNQRFSPSHGMHMR